MCCWGSKLGNAGNGWHPMKPETRNRETISWAIRCWAYFVPRFRMSRVLVLRGVRYHPFSPFQGRVDSKQHPVQTLGDAVWSWMACSAVTVPLLNPTESDWQGLCAPNLWKQDTGQMLIAQKFKPDPRWILQQDSCFCGRKTVSYLVNYSSHLESGAAPVGHSFKTCSTGSKQ